MLNHTVILITQVVKFYTLKSRLFKFFHINFVESRFTNYQVLLSLNNQTSKNKLFFFVLNKKESKVKRKKKT